MLNKLMAWIAALGQNIQFVAFWAHFFTAAWLVEHLPHKPFVAVSIIIFAAAKEFLFDSRYETNPPQTFMDNLQDFLGWAGGAVIGLLF
jgi:hypothetical protein